MTEEKLIESLLKAIPMEGVTAADVLLAWLVVGLITYGVLWMFDLSSESNRRRFALFSLVASTVTSMLFLSMVGAFDTADEGTARQVFSFWILFSLFVFIIPYLIFLYKNRKNGINNIAPTSGVEVDSPYDPKLYNHEEDDPWNKAYEVPPKGKP